MHNLASAGLYKETLLFSKNLLGIEYHENVGLGIRKKRRRGKKKGTFQISKKYGRMRNKLNTS